MRLEDLKQSIRAQAAGLGIGAHPRVK
jgi:hypothetical protein